MDLKLNAFVKSNIDETADVVMVFGLDQKDLDGCSFSDPKCKGVAQWDPNFNPNTVEAQLALQVRFKQKKTLKFEAKRAFRHVCFEQLDNSSSFDQEYKSHRNFFIYDNIDL